VLCRFSFSNTSHIVGKGDSMKSDRHGLTHCHLPLHSCGSTSNAWQRIPLQQMSDGGATESQDATSKSCCWLSNVRNGFTVFWDCSGQCSRPRGPSDNVGGRHAVWQVASIARLCASRRWARRDESMTKRRWGPVGGRQPETFRRRCAA
jgi:hypothetical protein